MIHNSSPTSHISLSTPLLHHSRSVHVPYTYPCLQVAADMDSSDSAGSKPALGLAWADTVTVRLVAHRREAVESEEECQKVCNYVLHN